MDMVPATYFENLKRYWRRRKYQRLDHNHKRMKVARLGNKQPRRVWKIRLVPKLRFKVMAKFHRAYVNMMTSLVVETKKMGLFGGKEIPKDRPVPMVASGSNQVVDGRLVMEVYKRLVSTRELAAMLV